MKKDHPKPGGLLQNRKIRSALGELGGATSGLLSENRSDRLGDLPSVDVAYIGAVFGGASNNVLPNIIHIIKLNAIFSPFGSSYSVFIIGITAAKHMRSHVVTSLDG